MKSQTFETALIVSLLSILLVQTFPLSTLYASKPEPPPDQIPTPTHDPDDPMYFESEEYWNQMGIDYIEENLSPEDEQYYIEHLRETSFRYNFKTSGDPRYRMDITHPPGEGINIHWILREIQMAKGSSIIVR